MHVRKLIEDENIPIYGMCTVDELAVACHWPFWVNLVEQVSVDIYTVSLPLKEMDWLPVNERTKQQMHIMNYPIRLLILIAPVSN